MWFEMVFGIHTNLNKSKLYIVGEVTNINGLANILGCAMGLFPFKLFII